MSTNSRHFSVKKKISLWPVLSIICLCLVILVSLSVVVKEHSVHTERPTVSATDTFDYAAGLATIQAKSYYVYDMYAHQVLFEKNEHVSLPLASITKLMTGLVVLENLPQSATVTIQADDLGYDGNGGRLLVGERWNPETLLNFSLIMSSNDGMMALARTLDEYEGSSGSSTIQLMNEEAQMLGMHDTVYANPTGLDISATTSGAYSSPYDIATLLQYILLYHPILITQTTKTAETFVSESGISHTAINTDLSIDKVPDMIASKTGYTLLAGGNLAVVFDAGFMHPIIVVVMGSTENGRFTDVEELVNLALHKLSH